AAVSIPCFAFAFAQSTKSVPFSGVGDGIFIFVIRLTIVIAMLAAVVYMLISRMVEHFFGY
ncbi:MAG: hypothetical protein WBA07_29755, partial [Rivularia sp. (in: cyanobacteria)]